MGMIQYIVHILLFNTPLKHDFNVEIAVVVVV